LKEVEESWPLSLVTDDKALVRQRMRQMRLVADQKHGPDAVIAVVRLVMAKRDEIGLAAGLVVAGYAPIATELDIRPLLARLDEAGLSCCLPEIAADGLLRFREWRPRDPLVPGPRGTWQPMPGAAEIEPDVLFVPLLAVDDDGFRLGQGGGYYDRTLRSLRARRPVIVIGIGYDVQRVKRLPRAAGDERVDWVVTETGALRVAL
jgi:5-formyltetrahydrofolate cyclo-ligase